jgi:hypothetical protein
VFAGPRILAPADSQRHVRYPHSGARARAQVVFLGLDILVPLMTGELLRFPKLARAYFALLAYMLEVYPERVAALPGAPPRPTLHPNLNLLTLP